MYLLFNTLTSERNDDKPLNESEKRARLRDDLKKAIALGQFRIHLQPLVKLDTYEIIGAEAFIRWEHQLYGTLLPEEFISIAEESDFILEMGDWVLNEVCRHYTKWMDEGLPAVKISINYSSLQFLQEDFAEHIHGIVSSYGLKPDFLTIEILERFAIRDYRLMKTNIDKLHEMGITVALDDFGTGFSSMEYLSRLNIDILKIDQLFVDTIPFNKINSTITETILALAEKLGILAVAEGIETETQYDFLRKRGCSFGQGYYFCKPMPPQKCKELIRSGHIEPDQVITTTADFRDKRKYERYKLLQLLEASMTILRCNGMEVHFGSTLVLIHNISGGGMCFFSTVSLPVKSKMMIQFTTNILGRELVMFGTPVWGKEVKNGLFKYGVKFRISDEERSGLLSLINEMQNQLLNEESNLEGDFTPLSPYTYFKV